ncbi:MAG TPA: ATP-binding protein [Polyangia bacterium]|nr:ATP-binding protein [Polyangia bacterium]
MIRSAALIDSLTPRPTVETREETSTLPTETLARLDRLASASALGAGLAHEIANPLGALLGALDEVTARLRELRRHGVATAPDLEALAADLELATAGAGLITDLVHDFQQFLRPAAATELADARVAVERALRLARPRLAAITRVDAQLASVPPVRGATSRLVQVVLNLLLNAAEALSQRARSENLVTVRLEVAGARALLEVSDNGPGLPLAIRDRVFDAGVSQRQGRASSGLGLAISRELVTRMGGAISVTSLPGAGTTFVVNLPLA